MKVPVIDRGECTKCEGCLAVCPAVFRWNQETDLIEVADMALYPEDCVAEAMVLCPAKCIAWEER